MNRNNEPLTLRDNLMLMLGHAHARRPVGPYALMSDDEGGFVINPLDQYTPDVISVSEPGENESVTITRWIKHINSYRKH